MTFYRRSNERNFWEIKSVLGQDWCSDLHFWFLYLSLWLIKTFLKFRPGVNKFIVIFSESFYYNDRLKDYAALLHLGGVARTLVGDFLNWIELHNYRSYRWSLAKWVNSSFKVVEKYKLCLKLVLIYNKSSPNITEKYYGAHVPMENCSSVPRSIPLQLNSTASEPISWNRRREVIEFIRCQELRLTYLSLFRRVVIEKCIRTILVILSFKTQRCFVTISMFSCFFFVCLFHSRESNE